MLIRRILELTGPLFAISPLEPARTVSRGFTIGSVARIWMPSRPKRRALPQTVVPSIRGFVQVGQPELTAESHRGLTLRIVPAPAAPVSRRVRKHGFSNPMFSGFRPNRSRLIHLSRTAHHPVAVTPAEQIARPANGSATSQTRSASRKWCRM